MATRTPKYQLILHEATDQISRTAINENTTKTEAALDGLQQNVSSLQQNLNTVQNTIKSRNYTLNATQTLTLTHPDTLFSWLIFVRGNFGQGFGMYYVTGYSIGGEARNQVYPIVPNSVVTVSKTALNAFDVVNTHAQSPVTVTVVAIASPLPTN